jgi:hypothetical protein
MGLEPEVQNASLKKISGPYFILFYCTVYYFFLLIRWSKCEILKFEDVPQRYFFQKLKYIFIFKPWIRFRILNTDPDPET